MKKFKYIILGAGPSGLSFANRLIQNGSNFKDILLLEKESDVGGLCRSTQVDGAPLDFGGGHFLDIKKKNVLEFMFRFLPEIEWNKFNRISRIRLRNHEVDHPIESNLWQLDINSQLDFLQSIAEAGSARGVPMPNNFSNYIRWKLGERIADEYMIPYNEKIWSTELSNLGTYWLNKLPNVSFRETLKSSLESKAFGDLPAHGTFLYPKNYGYGEVWKRMGDSIATSVICNVNIESIDLDTLIVNRQWQANTIISTIPWVCWLNFCSLNDSIKSLINNLKYSSINIDYYRDSIKGDAHWIYEPDKNISYHRILARSNFCSKARGHWTETNSKRSDIKSNEFSYHNQFAYPINTITKPTTIKEIVTWAASKNIISLGRWGLWDHMNSDVAVYQALELADKLFHENSQ